jgi:signal recognition particle subunit SRP54
MAPFEGLTQRLQSVFRLLKGKKTLAAEDVDIVLREVRVALLEADVHVSVVKKFVERIRTQATGVVLAPEFTAEMAVIAMVRDELIDALGGEMAAFSLPAGTSVVMMVGLQGAGKTTTTAKIARHLIDEQRKPLLVACDPYRPAAITQLQVLGAQIDVPVFARDASVSPVVVAQEALEYAKAHGRDVVILDTAGRLHIDEALMQELSGMKDVVKPQEILLTIDAMTGQDAVTVAKQFHEALDISGIVLTKLDGDTRGGAALSVKSVAGCSIKFAATGEKLDALDVFYPDRMASRILGMGDILTLIEKTQAAIDARDAEEVERKLLAEQYTFDDFLDQMRAFQKMGPVDQILDLIPGLRNNEALKNARIDAKKIKRVEAIILSMTAKERAHPELLKLPSRRKRLAAGSGCALSEVANLLTNFDAMRQSMKKMLKKEQHNKAIKEQKFIKKGKKKVLEPEIKKAVAKKKRFPF